MDAIELSVFANRIVAICEEMGAVLERAAFSPNIKDRLDFSCAVFDEQGGLVAQAAHIPVHLGSMAYAMRDIVTKVDWHDGDMLILNDPFLGGTHLPDVTLIAPLFHEQVLVAFVANRAHHADIGAAVPGSMPVSSHLDEEGMVIPPSKLIRHGALDEHLFQALINNVGNPAQAQGDFSAQISANRLALARLKELVTLFGVLRYNTGVSALNDYAERLACAVIADIPDGEYTFTDYMDDDGLGHYDIPIAVLITVMGSRVHVNFNGTSKQVEGNINCPLSVAAAAVFYVFRCLMPAQIPSCAGTFRPISLEAEKGLLINANRPAAVAAGNVETSSRIVDVIMGALAKAIPEKMAAASQGTMNNIAMGSRTDDRFWDYYETIGGGMGASAVAEGLSAVQTHMTNTLNTPIESLESHFPLRINRYEIRRDSGGSGQHHGGDGIIREYEFLEATQITLLTERRTRGAWGLAGGEAGKAGINCLSGRRLPGKVQTEVEAGDHLTIETPGGGGWGKKE